MTTQFLTRAHSQLKSLRSDLDTLETALHAKPGARSLMQRLRAEYDLIGSRIEGLTKTARPPVPQKIADTESHWLALQAVVALHHEALATA